VALRADASDLRPRGRSQKQGWKLGTFAARRPGQSCVVLAAGCWRVQKLTLADWHRGRLFFASTPSVCGLTLLDYEIVTKPHNRYNTPGIIAHLFFGYSGNVLAYHACVCRAASARFATIANNMGASLEKARAPATVAIPAYNTHSAK